MGERFLTVKETAEKLGISRMTLDRWQRKGHFPKAYVLAPHRVGFKNSEVEAWIESRPQAERVYTPPDPVKENARREAWDAKRKAAAAAKADAKVGQKTV